MADPVLPSKAPALPSIDYASATAALKSAQPGYKLDSVLANIGAKNYASQAQLDADVAWALNA